MILSVIVKPFGSSTVRLKRTWAQTEHVGTPCSALTVDTHRSTDGDNSAHGTGASGCKLVAGLADARWRQERTSGLKVVVDIIAHKSLGMDAGEQADIDKLMVKDS